LPLRGAYRLALLTFAMMTDAASAQSRTFYNASGKG
jgi:hypothetical protein